MLLFADGFDHYGNVANLLENVYSLNFSMVFVPGSGRGGSNCLRQTSNNFNVLKRPLPSNKTTIGFGLAIKHNNISDYINLLSLEIGGAVQLYFGISVTGKFQVKSNLYTNILAESAVSVPIGAYYHLEVRTFIHDTVGTVEVRLNESQTILSYVGPTKLQVAGGCDVIALGSGGSLGTPVDTLYDDFVVWDTLGTSENTFLGDIRLRTILPVADTAVADWTKSAGPNGWDLINNVPPINTEFVSSNAAAQASEFTLQSIPGNASSIPAVIVVSRQIKTDTGAATSKIGINSNSNLAMGLDQNISTGHAYFQSIYNLNPNGGVGWTAAQVNLLRARIERTT